LREPLYLADVTKPPPDTPTIRDAYNEHNVIKSFAALPIKRQENLIGIVFVNCQETAIFSQGRRRALEHFADQAAVAIENAKLLQEVGDRARRNEALVGERDQTLMKLREEQEKSMAAGRLAAVNTVAAGFVHSMNNIAGTIPVRVQQIRELLNPSDANHSAICRFLDSIEWDAESALRKAEAIKSPDLDPADLELVHLEDLVSTVLGRLPTVSGIEIEDTFDVDLPKVLVYSIQFMDALEDIIRNGIEAIAESGRITITCSEDPEELRSCVCIEVKDTGCGIPDEDLSKIFERPYSTKPNGMGLALWRAKALVESLGGRIAASSEVGVGTAIRIRLPAAEGGEA
jgi:signal transduction histidine kinase